MLEKTTKNLIANFTGKFYAAFINLAFVPLYIKFIGVEGYGLVGFYATMQAVFNLLDMGFSGTIKRELACASENDEGAVKSGDFLATMQGLYFAVAIIVCVLTILVSPLIARYWLSSGNLTVDVLGEVVALFGFIIATRMLYGFYSGGVLGLQKQVLYNWVNSIFVTVRSGGAVLVLWLVSPTTTVFFAWQAISGLAGVVVIGYMLWASLPKRSRRAKFKLRMVLDIWRYTAGLSINSVLGILLNQVDKIVLTKMLPLEMFGYYALAGTIASSLQYLGAPVYMTYFPSFAKLASQRLTDKLSAEYHKATQIMAVAVFPVAGIFIFFSRELIFAWTKDANIVNNAWLLASILSLGTALNLFAAMPYNLQLSYKHTRFSVIANFVAVLVLAPALYFGIKHLGAVGAALVWVTLNVGYVLIFAQVVHRNFLVGQFSKWCFGDVAPVGATVALVGLVASLSMPSLDSRWLMLADLAFVYVCMLITAIVSAGLVRKLVFSAGRSFYANR